MKTTTKRKTAQKKKIRPKASKKLPRLLAWGVFLFLKISYNVYI